MKSGSKHSSVGEPLVSSAGEETFSKPGVQQFVVYTFLNVIFVVHYYLKEFDRYLNVDKRIA